MDFTADINVPTIAASADDTVTRDAGLLTLGMGTHLDPEVAILRALTEVAQSRATQINGAREDTVRADFAREAGYERMKRINKFYRLCGKRCPIIGVRMSQNCQKHTNCI